jgi:DNA mismatch repair protein MutL
MPRILQLPPTVVTKIAAGEVIERPASVVKELLENAIDAGAGRIEVDLEQGGTELIRVVDDGCGIEPDDLPLAFASHATSKLRDADDLFRIGTLGFRGEALASIGGVAQVALQSRAAGRADGAEVTCHGGTLAAVRPWNGSPGTRVEVRHLFYNTPVRRRFLRTQATEVGHVCEAVTRLVLAHPTLHLVLRHNNKLVYEVPGTAGLFDRVGLFFGAEVANHLYQLDAAQGPVRLTGYVADPACERGNAKLQYLFVNGRWVRDRSLAHALQEGYRGLLLTGRYAVGFLFLTLPPDAVDVNVHPTKSEVRFRDGSMLYHLVLATVRDRLRQANLVPRLQAPREDSGPPLSSWERGPGGEGGLSTQYSVLGTQSPLASFPQEERGEPSAATGSGWGLSASAPPAPHLSFPDTPSPPHNLTTPPPALPAGARAIQLHDAYLVVETPDGMLVIDQHALHERILFEQLRRRVQAGQLERQRLLIPEPIDLPAEQAARVLEAKGDLAGLGLEVEDFGGGTVLLASYPAILGRAAPATVFRGVADVLVAKDRPPTRDQLLERVLATMACRAAVKAGDRLTPEEIASLLEQRELADNTHHCPHGRPTSLLFSRHELDRQFRRLG